jgi:hypothetical protein
VWRFAIAISAVELVVVLRGWSVTRQSSRRTWLGQGVSRTLRDEKTIGEDSLRVHIPFPSDPMPASRDARSMTVHSGLRCGATARAAIQPGCRRHSEHAKRGKCTKEGDGPIETAERVGMAAKVGFTVS